MNRGKPLAWSLREEIKRRRTENGESKSKIAREMKVARETVKKYCGGV